MEPFILHFREMGEAQLSLVGGKGVNLGKLAQFTGVQVPDGFCVTTAAYKKAIAQQEEISALVAQLGELHAGDRDAVQDLSRKIREAIIQLEIPMAVAEEVSRCLARLGEGQAYAVRSSATAEDLPASSFAGQQDTYLNIIGTEAILHHIKRCWASLFTERAVMYRMQNEWDHRQVHLAVIIQRMAFPEVSGTLFTADPMTSNRKRITIEASFGLGEALVAGVVSPDSYQVQDGKMVERQIAAKKVAIYAVKEGGTQTRQLPPALQNASALTEQQALHLAELGRQIEAQLGSPQDIEWCLEGDTFYVLQSRPITTLFPIPERDDQENHVYLSVGHQQMMTDAMRPLGLSFFLLTTRAPMRHAGGRLFVDVTLLLTRPESRDKLLETMGQSDPLMKDALLSVLARNGFIPQGPGTEPVEGPDQSGKVVSTAGFASQLENDPAIAADLIARSQASLEELKHALQTKTGSGLLAFIREDIQRLQQLLEDPQSMKVILGAMDAFTWLNEHMEEWLGEGSAASVLSQAAPNNITSEMGLALLDTADAIRPYPEVVAFLERVERDDFLQDLDRLEGGQVARDAIEAYLNRYGMRCVGEIDITRTRWIEKPTTIISTLLSHIKNVEPHASERRVKEGQKHAHEKEQDLLARLERLPDGKQKVAETKRMISLLRNFLGYREYPKYAMMGRYFLYKQALLREAERLVQDNVIQEREDIYYLTFAELEKVIRDQQLDDQIIHKRKAAHRFYQKLTPPRVLTSDGEAISGQYKREDLPADALIGLPVSSGVIEGRARVILRMEDAELEEGDILVTAFTDPSWTPLFVSVKGLVTEVGGLMTHGAVIAREYGLPAVVAVAEATRRIKDGQRIRVHGDEGYIEIL